MVKNMSEVLDVTINVNEGDGDPETMTIREALATIGVSISDLSDTRNRKHFFFQVSQLIVAVKRNTPVDDWRKAILEAVVRFLERLVNLIKPD